MIKWLINVLKYVRKICGMPVRDKPRSNNEQVSHARRIFHLGIKFKFLYQVFHSIIVLLHYCYKKLVYNSKTFPNKGNLPLEYL